MTFHCDVAVGLPYFGRDSLETFVSEETGFNFFQMNTGSILLTGKQISYSRNVGGIENEKKFWMMPNWKE